MTIFSVTKTLGAAALTLALTTGAAQAQVAAAEEAALRVTQQEQFEAMFSAPDDVDLMFQYALTSIRLQDFEAAITTLERILIFNPNLPRVKVELGASYFRIGSYPVAKFYFTEVLNDDSAAPDLKERVQGFLDEIERRTRTSYFTGRIGPDFVFTTNANFGPEDRNAILFGTPAVLLGANVTDQTDFGVGLSGQVSHVYDLGLTSDDVWRTDLAFSAVRYADVSEGATDVALLRSGPRLSLDADRHGPKIRPYGEVSHIRFGNDPLQSTIGGGFELTDTLDQSTSLFSDLRVAWVDNHTPTAAVDQDGLSVRGTAGLNYFADKNLSLRGFGVAEFSGAETDSQQSFEFGVGGSATYRYDSAFEMASRDWALNGGFRLVYRVFDEPDFQTDPTKDREDLDVRLHLGHTAYLEDNLSVVARAEYFIRDSNVRNFDLDRFTARLGFRYSF